MERSDMTQAKRRVLACLKRCDSMTAGELATMLELTDVAIRQHLAALEERGWVSQSASPPAGRGRPSLRWSLAESAAKLFPDRHGELTVSLMDAMRQAIGKRGVLRVIDARAAAQIRTYQSQMPGQSATLRRRVIALAAIRTGEGYMAEVVTEGKGVFLLIEHHCPICEAATNCTGLCDAELHVFQETLGVTICVERTEHLLGVDRRCVYRIKKQR